jgi:hypothetical protein
MRPTFCQAVLNHLLANLRTLRAILNAHLHVVRHAFKNGFYRLFRSTQSRLKVHNFLPFMKARRMLQFDDQTS